MYVQIVYKNVNNYKPMYWGEEENVFLVELSFLDSSVLGLSLEKDNAWFNQLTKLYVNVYDNSLWIS